MLRLLRALIARIRKRGVPSVVKVFVAAIAVHIQQGHHVQCDFRVGLMEVAKE